MWLEDGEWKRVQATIPVACIDVLPLRLAETPADAGQGQRQGSRAAPPPDNAAVREPSSFTLDGRRVEAVGLIRRETPHQGRRWCVVGGRMHRDESFAAAVTRQVRETLGEAVRFTLPADAQPAYVAQYFTMPRPGELYDPRQHAIGMTFVLPVDGEVRPGGEALAFEWYDPARLPAAAEFGFGQECVVAECLRTIRGDLRPSG